MQPAAQAACHVKKWQTGFLPGMLPILSSQSHQNVYFIPVRFSSTATYTFYVPLSMLIFISINHFIYGIGKHKEGQEIDHFTYGIGKTFGLRPLHPTF